MANVEINDLTADTSPLDTDELEIQKTGGGLSRKMTRKNLLTGVYGILSVQGNSTAETTVDSTPRLITAWNTNGASNNMTPTHSTDSIDVNDSFTGVFSVDVSISFSGTLSSTYQIEIYVYDGASWNASGFAMDRKLGTGGDVGSASISGIVTLGTGDKIGLYQSTTDGSAMTVTEAQLKAVRIG